MPVDILHAGKIATRLTKQVTSRLTPAGRRRRAIEQAAIDSPIARPGLHHVDEQGSFPNDGLSIAYYRVGPKAEDDNHTTVVFVHGFTLAADSFFLQVDYLQRYFPEATSLLVDLRGHGRTGKVDPGCCTIAGTADDVMEAIRLHAPRGRLILVGHSLGGMSVLNLLRRADEDITQRICGVLLISTAMQSLASQGVPQVLASPIANRVHQALEVAPDAAQALRNDVAELLAPALAATVFYKDGTPYNVIQFHASMIHDTPLETIVGFFDDLQDHEELDAARFLTAQRGVAVVGQKDRFTPPAQTELICTTWSGADMVVLRGVGHMVILEDADSVNRQLGRLVAATLPHLTGA